MLASMLRPSSARWAVPLFSAPPLGEGRTDTSIERSDRYSGAPTHREFELEPAIRPAPLVQTKQQVLKALWRNKQIDFRNGDALIGK